MRKTQYIDLIEIGSRIARTRRELNMTQEQLAQKTGLSTNYISKIENGNSQATLDKIAHISVELETTILYLLTGTVLSGDIEASHFEKMKLIHPSLKPALFTLIDSLVEVSNNMN